MRGVVRSMLLCYQFMERIICRRLVLGLTCRLFAGGGFEDSRVRDSDWS